MASKKKIDPVLEGIKKLAEIRKEKHSEYGDINSRQGEVLLSLFPNGVPSIETEQEINRFSNLNMMVCKIVRYCENFEEGHDDSLDDISVYSQMQKALDSEL